MNKEDIKAGLRRLGLKKGDSVGVHSSLRRFGHVEGGADAVIDALLEIVGQEGNIVMSTHSANVSEDLRTPEEIAIGVSWLLKLLPYDPEETPVRTGIIPETFRKRKGVVRGSHPSNSIAALGPNAKELSEGWHRLLEHDGYVLLIGVGLESCTAMHLAEKRVQLPQRILEKITPPHWLIEKYPEGEWEWDFGPYPDFARLTNPCIERGIMKTVKVGEATLELVKLSELIDLYVEYLKMDPDLFYGKSRALEKQHKTSRRQKKQSHQHTSTRNIRTRQRARKRRFSEPVVVGLFMKFHSAFTFLQLGTLASRNGYN